MIPMSTVVTLEEADSKMQYGGKAANLSRLLTAGLPVPPGFAVGIRAFSDGKLTPSAVGELKNLIDESKIYAVRSSATSEDAEDASWAGQFETFLSVTNKDVLSAIEKCHDSTKDRAKSYAKEMGEQSKNFNIAVVVQEMLDPQYAGVLFTRNPVSGANELVIEYVKGIGEKLVSGKADPERLVVNKNVDNQVPFNLGKLVEYAKSAEKTFGAPQDIEWASAGEKIWLLQSRPITTLPKQDETFEIGQPGDLFYWGPSRTDPLYMSDFMVATGSIFKEQCADPNWPSPPKTIVLFHDHQMVWLNNSEQFNSYAAGAFEAYGKVRTLRADVDEWHQRCRGLDTAAETKADVFAELVLAWGKTIHAEFSLYGAEIVIGKMLSRLPESERREVWQEFTIPEQPGFLQQIDNEILSGVTTKMLAERYPWIQDGYFGVTGKATEYFDKRRPEIVNGVSSKVGDRNRRDALATRLALSAEEIAALDLARGLAKFMDDRKAWMMRTRTYLARLKTNPGPNNGWMYDAGFVSLFDKSKVKELWKKYIDYVVIKSDLKGTVASNAGQESAEGEVVVIDSPNVSVPAQKILVVPSTSPSYVPLMRNAKALITDHGGMMSHAAIVAREFSLPCIVGTKTATKQLKSGDTVVMDLVTGSIQRLG